MLVHIAEFGLGLAFSATYHALSWAVMAEEMHNPHFLLTVVGCRYPEQTT